MSMQTMCQTQLSLTRAPVTADGAGGVARTFATVATFLAFVYTGNPKPSEAFGREAERNPATVLTSVNVGAVNGDVIQGWDYPLKVLSQRAMNTGGVAAFKNVYLISCEQITPV